MARHIAASGVRAGQWVTCTAKNSCTLGGTHISERDFYATKAFVVEQVGKPVKASEIGQKAYHEFKKASVGKEEEWAKKAECLARKDKKLGPTYAGEVFEGEKNVLPLAKPKAKFFPAGSTIPRPKPATSKPNPISQQKPGVQQEPKRLRTIQIPEVANYLLTGDKEEMRKAMDNWEFSDETVKAVIGLRVKYQTYDYPSRDDIEYKNTKNGKILKYADIPERIEYEKTGDEKHLQALKDDYGFFDDHLQRMRLDRIKRVSKEAGEKVLAEHQKKKEDEAEERQRRREEKRARPGLLRRIYNKI